MKFEYFGGAQRSPEWFELRRGRVTASALWRWMSVSKAKDKEGQPLKERLDYEKELMFERQFNTSFEKFQTDAMKAGVEFEDFARRQYEKIKNVTVDECGCWYSDNFVASPDGTIGKDGLLEVKVVGDNTFTEILTSGVPDKYMKQIQGQLMASGRKWCDFVAINLNTQKVKIIRVFPDPELHEWIELLLQEKLVTEPLDTEEVFSFVDAVPEGDQPFEAPILNNQESKGW